MVDLVFQDTDRVGGDDRDLLEANLQLDGLILATLRVDIGKYVQFGIISGWFGFLRRAPRVTDG